MVWDGRGQGPSSHSGEVQFLTVCSHALHQPHGQHAAYTAVAGCNRPLPCSLLQLLPMTGWAGSAGGTQPEYTNTPTQGFCIVAHANKDLLLTWCVHL